MSHHYIKTENIEYSYYKGAKAIDGISFYIGHGEKVALVGSNGAGKSTLLLLLNALIFTEKGTIDIGNTFISEKTAKLIRQKVGFIFQNSDNQLFMPTVEDEIAFGPINMGLPKDEVERRVNNALKIVDCENLKGSITSHLSGGQKRSIAIASVLAMEPEILLMDEPSSNLDSYSRRLLIDQIQSFSHTCIIATHDLEMVWELCPRSIVMDNGKIVFDGSSKELFYNKELLKKCKLEQPYLAKIEELTSCKQRNSIN